MFVIDGEANGQTIESTTMSNDAFAAFCAGIPLLVLAADNSPITFRIAGNLDPKPRP